MLIPALALYVSKYEALHELTAVFFRCHLLQISGNNLNTENWLKPSINVVNNYSDLIQNFIIHHDEKPRLI
jgi:hypothetical protein